MAHAKSPSFSKRVNYDFTLRIGKITEPGEGSTRGALSRVRSRTLYKHEVVASRRSSESRARPGTSGTRRS